MFRWATGRAKFDTPPKKMGGYFFAPNLPLAQLAEGQPGTRGLGSGVYQLLLLAAVALVYSNLTYDEGNMVNKEDDV